MKGSLFGKYRPARRARRSGGPNLEALEARQLLADLRVTTIIDDINLTGSLRSAIAASNNTPGRDRIIFEIPGDGPHVIELRGPLQPLTDPVDILGLTQPGAVSGPARIVLDGSNAGSSAHGLRIAAGGTLVEGLGFANFGGAGIRVESSSVVLRANVVGLDSAGRVAAPNGGDGIVLAGVRNVEIGGLGDGAGNIIAGNLGAGISIINGASTNRIIGNFIGTDRTGRSGIGNLAGISITNGGATQIGDELPTGGNTISGNRGPGILISGANSANTRILGNRIGSNPAGTLSLGNAGPGIALENAGQTSIGGTADGTGNTIVANAGAGVRVDASPGARLEGNFIGTTAGGTALGNAGHGVSISGSNGVRVGGTQAGAGNRIHHNQGAGVVVVGSVNVPILGNSIDANVGLGIDLGDDGVTPNDDRDRDTGANNLQNFPVITQAATASGQTLVQGFLQSTPLQTFYLEFFSQPGEHPAGHGQGGTRIGTAVVTTNGAGLGLFNRLLPTPTQVGHFVTATATTDPAATGNTSEFSASRGITRAGQVDLTLQIAADAQPATINETLEYTIWVANTGPDASTDTVLNVALPPSFVIEPGGVIPDQGTASIVGNEIEVNLGRIAANAMATIRIRVRPTITGPFNVTASVRGAEIDTSPQGNSVIFGTTVSSPADLRLIGTTEPGRGVEGRELAYVARIVNQGPGQARNIRLVGTVPDGLAITNLAIGQGTIERVGDEIRAFVGAIPNGGVIAVRVTGVAAAAGAYPITFTVESDQIDADPSNNRITVVGDVRRNAEVSVRVVPDRSEVLSGQEVVYTIRARGDSGVAAQNAVLRGVFSTAAFELVEPTTVGGGAITVVDGVVSTTLATLAPGEEATLTLRLRARAGFAGRSEVRGLIELDREVDLTPENNAQSVRTAINPADLSVTMRPGPNPAVAGQELRILVEVRNAGPAAARNVIVLANYPPDARFVAADGPGLAGLVGEGEVRYSIGDLAPGATAVLGMVIVPERVGGVGATARIESFEGGFDPRADNDSARLVVAAGSADLGVTVEASAGSVFVGGVLTYTARVTNTGHAPADGSALVLALPPGLAFASATASQGVVGLYGGTVAAELGTIAPGQAATVTIRLTAVAEGQRNLTFRVGSRAFDANTANDRAAVGVRLVNAPGVIGLTTGRVEVREDAGTVELTLVRTEGTRGVVGVRYETFDGNARAGVNYTPRAGEVVFADGQTTATIAIPILRDGAPTGPIAFGVRLTGATGGAGLGGQAGVTVAIEDLDADTTPPFVTDVQILGGAGPITGVVIQFSEPLDPNSASNPAHFWIAGQDGGRPALAPPAYDALSRTVTLILAAPLPAGAFYNVVATDGVADIRGNRLDGDGSGGAGGAYVASFARGPRLAYNDAAGNLVSLALNRGGYLEMIRGADGDSRVLRVVGPLQGRSILQGSVRRLGVGGTGRTNLGRIDASRIGPAASRLTSPPFYVDAQLATPAAIIRPGATPRGGVAARLWARG